MKALRLVALSGALLAVGGCATLQQLAALRDVDFALDRVARLSLAGIDLDEKRSYGDLGITDVARLTLALSRNELPLSFDLLVRGENPTENGTDARLVRFAWTLLLEDRETVSGVFDDEVVFSPGVPATFPLTISLDLLDFFEGSAQDLGELALSLAGEGGSPKNVAIRAVPTINTALGPIQYPGTITILSAEIGDDADDSPHEGW